MKIVFYKDLLQCAVGCGSLGKDLILIGRVPLNNREVGHTGCFPSGLGDE